MKLNKNLFSLSLIFSISPAFASVVNTSDKWPEPDNIKVCWQIEKPPALAELIPELSDIQTAEDIDKIDDERIKVLHKAYGNIIPGELAQAAFMESLASIFDEKTGFKYPIPELSYIKNTEEIFEIDNEKLKYLHSAYGNFIPREIKLFKYHLTVVLQQKVGFTLIDKKIPFYKGLTEHFVDNSYHDKTNIRFTGWKDCAKDDLDSTNNIRISFNTMLMGNKYITTGAYEGGAGRPNERNKGSATLKITVPPKLNNNTFNFLKNTVIHELGHALGLRHEQNRTDKGICYTNMYVHPKSIIIDGTSTKEGGYNHYVGSYDSDSIMNYCSSSSEIAKGELTRGDLKGLAYLYPDFVKVKPMSCTKHPESRPLPSHISHKKYCQGYRNQASCESKRWHDKPVCKWQ
ncbi:hypothetical protein H0A36_26640 [Endozoicomonas sp. SM1973]|uniref:Peptidase metallopeptidase domain-containing protein n=1 Tax=Spartinivicinus marinus TaxID=2994442 RepID=A0A853IJM8_9GAMM|nr:M57 family metalloprotease [Spartinivicinus marinus]NYZ69597.1 hypothetical protein [Spartinivicinus marinus]